VNVRGIIGHLITSLFEAVSSNKLLIVVINYWDPGERSKYGYWAMGWMSWGLDPSKGKKFFFLFETYKTGSGADPAFYLLGSRVKAVGT